MPAALTELKQAAIVNTLRSCQLFTGLPPQDLANVAAISVSRRLARGEYLFREGDPADVCALEPTQVLLVQKSGILALLRRQPELALRMLGSMSIHLRVLVGQLEDLTLKDVETRLANWLVRRCPNPESSS